MLKIGIGTAAVIGAGLFWIFNGMLFTVGPVETFERGRDLIGWAGSLQEGAGNADAATQAATPASQVGVAPNDPCGGIVAWSNEMSPLYDRGEELSVAIASQTADIDAAQLKLWADEIDQLARAQAQRDPPPAAAEASRLFVQANQQLARLLRLIADGAVQTPTSTETANMKRTFGATERLFNEAEREYEQLASQCADELNDVAIADEARTATAGPTRPPESCDGYAQWGQDLGQAVVDTGIGGGDPKALEERFTQALRDLDIQRLRYLQGKAVDARRLREISTEMSDAVVILDQVEPPPIASRAHDLVRDSYELAGAIADDLRTDRFHVDSWHQLFDSAREITAEAEFLTQHCG